MRSFVLWIIILGSTVLALLFGITWSSRLNLEYNEEGRYFDTNALVTYDQAALLVYGALTLLFTLIGIGGYIYTAKSFNNLIKEVKL
ncbi:hypothetical protein [Rufibacter hautae]|uniref:Uncharacterized protein n=1 Tax=Rufibacter hautae TaxID=2595005 RepID=A0A5B6TJQ7_9BACT|nr:hypothetical protein [Rufibacter hautae]KAA3439629.1 hypothetical protein FOA19_02825 [Rufibacter hautae]